MNAILKRVERREWSQVLVRAMKIHLKSKNFQKLGKSLGLQKKEISECTQIAVNTNGIEREAEQKWCQGTIFLDFESDQKMHVQNAAWSQTEHMFWITLFFHGKIT